MMKKMIAMMIASALACMAVTGLAEVATPSEALKPEVKPTEVVLSEATPEATIEATAVPTPEMTAVPTPEPTPVATPEMTAVPTPVATPEPTAVATPEMTAAATPEATPVPGKFTGSVRVRMHNPDKPLYYGDPVTLIAVVENANVEYTLRWECRDGHDDQREQRQGFHGDGSRSEFQGRIHAERGRLRARPDGAGHRKRWTAAAQHTGRTRKRALHMARSSM